MQSCPQTSTTKEVSTTAASSSVLILNTNYPGARYTPVVTDLNGNVDKLNRFQISEDLDVYYSCSVVFKGRFYVYGGQDSSYSIGHLVGCHLRYVNTLSGSLFAGGACTVADDKVFLCFNSASGSNYGYTKTCRTDTDPTGDFYEKIEESREDHELIRIASSESKSPRRDQANFYR